MMINQDVLNIITELLALEKRWRETNSLFYRNEDNVNILIERERRVLGNIKKIAKEGTESVILTRTLEAYLKLKERKLKVFKTWIKDHHYHSPLKRGQDLKSYHKLGDCHQQLIQEWGA